MMCNKQLYISTTNRTSLKKSRWNDRTDAFVKYSFVSRRLSDSIFSVANILCLAFIDRKILCSKASELTFNLTSVPLVPVMTFFFLAENISLSINTVTIICTWNLPWINIFSDFRCRFTNTMVSGTTFYAWFLSNVTEADFYKASSFLLYNICTLRTLHASFDPNAVLTHHVIFFS